MILTVKGILSMPIEVMSIKNNFYSQEKQEEMLNDYKSKYLTDSNLEIYKQVFSMLKELVSLNIQTLDDFNRQDVKDIIFPYRDWINGKNLSNSTKYNYYSTFRKGFRHVFNAWKYSQAPLTYFKMPSKFVTERNEADTKRVLENAQSRKVVDNWRDLVKTGVHLLDSESYLDIATGLLLLTGRRPVEILQTAKFKYINQDTVLFEGQLKTDNPVPYEIPVLHNAKKVIEALENLRDLKDFSGRTTKQVRQSTGKNIKYRVEDYFGLKFTPKDLRALYFTICYKLFADKSEVDTVYCAKILGHSRQGMTGSFLNPVVSLSYNRYILPD